MALNLMLEFAAKKVEGRGSLKAHALVAFEGIKKLIEVIQTVG